MGVWGEAVHVHVHGDADGGVDACDEHVYDDEHDLDDVCRSDVHDLDDVRRSDRTFGGRGGAFGDRGG